MTRSATQARPDSGAHLDVTRQEFSRRLAAHGHDAAEIHHLWDELALSEQERPETVRARGVGLGLGPVIAVYLGLLLVVAASVSLLAIYWNDLGAWGVLALGALYLAGYLVAGELMERRSLTQPAEALAAVSVGWLALVTYAVERLVGVWPTGASDIDHVHVGLTTIAVAGLAGAVALLALRPRPLLLVPMAVATAVLAVDLAELVFGNDLSDRQRVTFVLPLGVAWVGIGLWLDASRRRGYATWAHWVGLAAASGAISTLMPKTVAGFTVIGVLGAVSLFFSALVRHWSFTIVGAIGVLTAIASALDMLGRVAPLVIAIVGLALVVVGLRWSRWRERIRAGILARMPTAARSFVTRLAP